MNDFFHFNRFRLYFVKSILERPVQIGGTFALSFSVTALVYLLFKSMANIGLAQFMSFTLGLVGGGCLLASQVFGFFADTGNGASFFTLPVSAFEKWLTGVILVVLYVGCFLLFFRGLDTLFVHQYHANLNLHDARYQDRYDAVYIFTFLGEAQSVFIFFLNAAPAMLLGSLYFNKVGFIKVALVICGIYFFTFLINYFFCSVLFKDMLQSFPFHMVKIQNAGETGIVDMPPLFSQIYDLIAIYLLPAIFLFISFIRLKEKEV